MLIKTDSPGITTIPYKMMNGIETCDVIMEEVRVPKENLVGQEGQGWSHLMEALSRERFTMINFKGVSGPFDRFVQWVRTAEIDGEHLAEDPVTRQRLARQHLDMVGGKMMQLIAASRAVHNDYVPTVEAAASKSWRAVQSWPKADLAVEVMRSYGLMTEEDANAPIDGLWAAEYCWAGHEMSGAGGLDLNRKIIAQQGLGLPRWSN